MGLFDLFKNKKQSRPSQPVIEGPAIFYHEDDYLQVEIAPDENLAYLKAESGNVDEFSKEHFDGVGYTDIYVRNDDGKVKLKERCISPADLEQSLALLRLDRIANVLTGYGQSYRELHEDCIAFGKDYSAVYYEHKDNVVQNIWLTNHWSMDRDRLCDFLFDIGQKWSLLLQDWNLTATVDLKDKKAIEEYLRTYEIKKA